MTEPRKKSGRVFWTAVPLVAVALYVWSFGPVCWGFSRSSAVEIAIERSIQGLSDTERFDILDIWNLTDKFYAPILWGWHRGPNPIRNMIGWYANLGASYDLNVAAWNQGQVCVQRGAKKL
ncbi:MAG: hypothetical protein EXS05_23430 [Planctomycetaceae bacterium]|nr:hypothetical protein [Planctomycetaceae bacterium]